MTAERLLPQVVNADERTQARHEMLTVSVWHKNGDPQNATASTTVSVVRFQKARNKRFCVRLSAELNLVHATCVHAWSTCFEP